VLISEIKKWHWVITYDNPINGNYNSLPLALNRLGKVTKVRTKTTFVFAPKIKTTISQIRNAISSNLHPTKGNAFYMNLRTSNARTWSASKKKWIKTN
jgi:hypothetical protein